MNRQLYIPDPKKFIQYFENRSRKQFQPAVRKGTKMIRLAASKDTSMSVDRTNAPKIEMSSHIQDVVERAEAAQKRSKAIKRIAGKTIVTTKKVRREGKTRGSSINLKNTGPIHKNDIFG